jgi:hypothetical protein
LKQAAGKEHLPSINQANPPKVIGDWTDAEVPYRYGHAARERFGLRHPEWSPEVEAMLKSEWSEARDFGAHEWAAVKHFVRRGYEHRS